jgi:nucleoside-diphosphate-sugar epimerase
MKLLVFGFGYSALHISQRLQAAGAQITASVRTSAKAARLTQTGVTARVFSPEFCDEAIRADIAASESILVSIPPGETGDPVLSSFADHIAAAPNLRWLGYLSTVGVYGDHDGNWVDEKTPPARAQERSRIRAAAEQAWLAFGAARGVAVHIFRLGTKPARATGLGNGAAHRQARADLQSDSRHRYCSRDRSVAGSTAARRHL